jgi:hypothetical protein
MADSKRMTPEERLEKITKKRTKLAEEEAKIRAALRKKEDNLKHELGGLVLKAGLREESKNVILGILVSGFQVLEKSRSLFEDLGRKKFDLDEKARARKKAAMADDATPATPQPKPNAHYLNVPIEEKDEAKALGAKWDPDLKKWYCNPTDASLFSKWLPKQEA